MNTDTYSDLRKRLSPAIPGSRLITDELRKLAYGTDASFYRLVPRLVVRVESEEEIVALLKHAGNVGAPVTFRAAGTSLSGQAITDSVLALLGRTWNRWKIDTNGESITLQPGIIGGFANALLAPYGRKIGPDPASINAAMIGGIVANNASGMCCGTEQNSYKTLESMRLILSDGTVLDTGTESSKAAFRMLRPDLLQRLGELSERVRADSALADRIRRKYSMKNTTGYSLNALVDYDDPFEIIQHLMVGSEGTLGFIAEVTLQTVPDFPHKSTSLMLFPDIDTACNAVAILKDSAPVDAVELMDRASLRSIEMKDGIPHYLKQLDRQVASLLVETRAPDVESLQRNISSIKSSLAAVPTVLPLAFTENPNEFGKLWNIRKGLFPAIGAMRQTGTTVIIEDVAFPVPFLAKATMDLQDLFRMHRYDDAIIFGHARDGNLHFVFSQNFNAHDEIERYRHFMDDLTTMVVKKYDGSLKAEHGTGRNISPFVEFEWGKEAYDLMKEIKHIFDPENILNPGVILNSDPLAHVRNLKPLPAADPIIDKCIECGFCEIQCPSKDLTITPRQRIAVFREIKRLEQTKESHDLRRELQKGFDYFGDQTCATDGLCALTCPVHINTGDLVKELRSHQRGILANFIATLLARNMAATTSTARFGLNVLHGVSLLLGNTLMEKASAFFRTVTLRRIPLWNRYVPRGAPRPRKRLFREREKPKVVYVPSCMSRTFGPAPFVSSPSLIPLTQRLLRKAGFDVVMPQNIDHLCCGMAFASKGFNDQALMKSREMERALAETSEAGRFPILMDTSPCLLRMKESFDPALKMYDQVDFAAEFLLDRLPIRKTQASVAVHATCSTTKMGMDTALVELANKLSDSVIRPSGVGCCGWAGDRGFLFPELNASALANLRSQIPTDCTAGYSTSRTCEIGLSQHSGISYQSIFSLIDQCSDEEHRIG